MTERITERMLRDQLIRFCGAFNLDPDRYSISGYNPGDHYRCWVAKHVGAGERELFNGRRFSRRELHDHLYLAVLAREEEDPETWQRINATMTTYGAQGR